MIKSHYKNEFLNNLTDFTADLTYENSEDLLTFAKNLKTYDTVPVIL